MLTWVGSAYHPQASGYHCKMANAQVQKPARVRRLRLGRLAKSPLLAPGNPGYASLRCIVLVELQILAWFGCN
jgi:hypothetical protein